VFIGWWMDKKFYIESRIVFDVKKGDDVVCDNMDYP
jgi:hypothetical protein